MGFSFLYVGHTTNEFHFDGNLLVAHTYFISSHISCVSSFQRFFNNLAIIKYSPGALSFLSILIATSISSLHGIFSFSSTVRYIIFSLMVFTDSPNNYFNSSPNFSSNFFFFCYKYLCYCCLSLSAFLVYVFFVSLFVIPKKKITIVQVFLFNIFYFCFSRFFFLSHYTLAISVFVLNTLFSFKFQLLQYSFVSIFHSLFVVGIEPFRYVSLEFVSFRYSFHIRLFQK